jgi:2-pyrone-4,6-dicarboxylate lactonase
VSLDEMRELHAAGVRAVRFNFLRRLVDAAPTEAHLPAAEKAAKLGWHVVVYFEAPDLERLAAFLGAMPTIVVIDHMGRPDVSLGREHPQWRRFLRLLDENPHIWSKVSCPERLSITGPPGYDDVVPFAAEVVESFPDRVLWGTDWPHPNMTTHMPDEGALVDWIPRIAPTRELQRKLLVDNPMRLYWPEERS